MWIVLLLALVDLIEVPFDELRIPLLHNRLPRPSDEVEQVGLRCTPELDDAGQDGEELLDTRPGKVVRQDRGAERDESLAVRFPGRSLPLRLATGGLIALRLDLAIACRRLGGQPLAVQVRLDAPGELDLRRLFDRGPGEAGAAGEVLDGQTVEADEGDGRLELSTAAAPRPEPIALAAQ